MSQTILNDDEQSRWQCISTVPSGSPAKDGGRIWGSHSLPFGRLLIWLAITVLVSGDFGCGGAKKKKDDRTPVNGIVTYNDKPVEGADVSFSPVDSNGRGAAGMTNSAGKFSLGTSTAGDGALPGSYKVWITKTEVKAEKKALLPHEVAAIRKSGGKLPQDEIKALLPKKYSKVETTDLTAEVKKGEKNFFEFKLVD